MTRVRIAPPDAEEDVSAEQVVAHCGAGWLCHWCRPCSCRCSRCAVMPMTDTRPMVSNVHEESYFRLDSAARRAGESEE